MYFILIYGFPVTFVVFEWGLRHLLNVDATAFVGPALAASALSVLIPLTKPKKGDIESQNAKYVYVNARDQQLIPLIWVIVFAELFAWSAACYFSVTHPTTSTFHLPTHMFIGLVCYFISVVLVAVKGAV